MNFVLFTPGERVGVFFGSGFKSMVPPGCTHLISPCRCLSLNKKCPYIPSKLVLQGMLVTGTILPVVAHLASCELSLWSDLGDVLITSKSSGISVESISTPSAITSGISRNKRACSSGVWSSFLLSKYSNNVQI